MLLLTIATGVIIAEGLADDVNTYTARLRALPWAAMQVRAREEDARCLPEHHKDDEWRLLPFPFIELPDEKGLSLLGAMCKDVGLGGMFAAALKLHLPSDPNLRNP